jgi:hypothetical protein
MPMAFASTETPPSSASRPTSDESRTEVLANDGGQTPWGCLHLATVMFRRARQLKDGSRPRVEANGHKPLRIAFLEVQAGLIPWQVDPKS